MVPMSDRNPRVVSALKLTKASERRSVGRFLAEGINAIVAATPTGLVEEVFVTQEALARNPEVIDALPDSVPVYCVSARAVKGMSETVTPQGIVAVCSNSELELRTVLAELPDRAIVAVLVDVNEPGNAGAIMRVADAAGAGAVVLAGDSVDPTNGKAIRASAGSFFHLPVVRHRSTTDLLAELADAGFWTCATSARGEHSLVNLHEAINDKPRVAWLFGNEAHGLHDDVIESANTSVNIPIFGRAESLNLATAAALCLYESARVVRGLNSHGSGTV
ncbi:RNA methyltransferase [Hoyosella rhizosphaerae]|nr:RNA methyltransferase [Hoyosella rhizosphaerae]MBN4925502.1 RNA methyltransferase [Hoyosella rhizosphaerae]